jgi:hypothetical protein
MNTNTPSPRPEALRMIRNKIVLQRCPSLTKARPRPPVAH